MNEDELITEGCAVCGVLQKIEKYNSFVCVKCGQEHIHDNNCYRVELSEEQKVLLLSQLKGEEVTVPNIFGSFVCTRTITLEEKPCPEAYEVDYVKVKRRRTPATNWYKDGRNHREELGMLVRETDDKRWMVDIPDGAALQAFIENHGRIIISLNTEGLEPCYEIEIYDGERE